MLAVLLSSSHHMLTVQSHGNGYKGITFDLKDYILLPNHI